jgi:hypothetical protein
VVERNVKGVVPIGMMGRRDRYHRLLNETVQPKSTVLTSPRLGEIVGPFPKLCRYRVKMMSPYLSTYNLHGQARQQDSRMYTSTHYSQQNLHRAVPHPADSSQVWNLLTDPAVESAGNNNQHQQHQQHQHQALLQTSQSAPSLAPRTVPRPDNSAQMLNVLKASTAPIETDTRSDRQLRLTSPKPIPPTEHPHLSLHTLPSRTNIKRSFHTNLMTSVKKLRASPQNKPWVSPPRVGETILWDRKRDPIAKKGFVRSNLPSLMGVCGLETLNKSLVSIPRESYKNNPSSFIHPTFLSKQQMQCLDHDRVHEVLQTLRNQSHRPTLRFVQQGQGSAAEIAREQELTKREQKTKERLAFVDQTLYSPIKSARKQIIDSSGFVSGFKP